MQLVTTSLKRNESTFMSGFFFFNFPTSRPVYASIHSYKDPVSIMHSHVLISSSPITIAILFSCFFFEEHLATPQHQLYDPFMGHDPMVKNP